MKIVSTLSLVFHVITLRSENHLRCIWYHLHIHARIWKLLRLLLDNPHRIAAQLHFVPPCGSTRPEQS